MRVVSQARDRAVAQRRERNAAHGPHARSNAGRLFGRASIARGARIGAVALLVAPPTSGSVLLTQEEALAEAFPGAEVERHAEFLDPEQVERIESLAGSELSSRLVVRYRGLRGGESLGVAYFDAHTVRTLPETVMVLIGPDGAVVRVDVLSFDEPPDYLPRRRWFEQFGGKMLDDGLSLKRGIRGVTGATLSSRAVTAAVRRALAIHTVLGEPGDGEQEDR